MTGTAGPEAARVVGPTSRTGRTNGPGFGRGSRELGAGSQTNKEKEPPLEAQSNGTDLTPPQDRVRGVCGRRLVRSIAATMADVQQVRLATPSRIDVCRVRNGSGHRFSNLHTVPATRLKGTRSCELVLRRLARPYSFNFRPSCRLAARRLDREAPDSSRIRGDFGPTRTCDAGEAAAVSVPARTRRRSKAPSMARTQHARQARRCFSTSTRGSGSSQMRRCATVCACAWLC